MITVEFVQFGVFLAFWVVLMRVAASKLAGTRVGAAVAFVTP